MKILHLFPYLPTPPTFGGALRVYHILKHLVKNHDVTVGGFSEKGDLAMFRETFPEVTGKTLFINRNTSRFRRLKQLTSFFTNHSYWYNWAESPELERKVRDLVRRESFDFILGEFATMGHFDLKTNAIRILDAHNVEYDNFRRMSKLEGSWLRRKFYTREYKKSYSEEIEIFKRHDALFVTSTRDGAIIKRDAPEPPQFVIPNGVDTDYFEPGDINPESYSMVFTGTMGYVPNYDGIRYFIEEIFPLITKKVPEAKIYVVGSNPPSLLKKYQSDSIIITGFVDDVRPYIDKAKVFVVPLKMGSGTRLKVVEALSMKKPVVSTSIGCEGIEVKDEEHLLVRDNPKEFAEGVLRLFKDQKTRERLVSNGYELVKKKYDWSVIGQSIEEAFHQLINKPLPVVNS